MAGKRVYDVPTNASAEHGVVLLDGPNGVAVSFTPAAARASAQAILAAADVADTQENGPSGPPAW